jgi:hypothetical protein
MIRPRLRLFKVAPAAGLGALALALAGALAGTAAAQPASGPDDADGDAAAGSFDAGENEDGPAPAAPPATFAVPLVELGGGANGSVAAAGEAWTTWRYGHSKGRPSIDETTTRVRVSGSGRSLDGLVVGFSVGLLVPELRTGPAAATATLAAAWARRDRIDVPAEIEWDASALDAGAPARASGQAVTITSVEEISHTAERRAEVIVEVTHYRLHGRVDVTLPCKRSVPLLRPSCRPETVRGTF